MSETLKLYQLPTSTNSVKVRLALGYKKLACEKITVDSKDRAEVIKLSGQPLTPVLMHGNTAVFDSAGILRYLDGNFRSTPKLFTENYDEMHEIEQWEKFARVELPEPVRTLYRQFSAEKKDAAAISGASKQLTDITARIEERLAKSSWLVGDRMTAADVTAAPTVYYGMIPPGTITTGGAGQFIAENLKLGAGRDRTRDWAKRVMAFDK